ncbi:hypothetical protein F383_27421 [Gossypium arboreum]|uniref:Uncharacterized protein n=1 Tax=Gossypium arboreum TaxID=29729 RepID=A0A0B0MT23_GOSAR|nr:hypothetical protein F383_27421 [Gossypium arboreum]
MSGTCIGLEIYKCKTCLGHDISHDI